MNNFTSTKKMILMITLLSVSSLTAQTIINGFFPKKKDLTIASSYSSKSYDKFYIGDDLTNGNPLDMGKISSSVYSLYGEYGILNWLSTTASLPYMTVENEAGVPDPIQEVNQVEGFQDLNVYLKAKVLDQKFKNNSKITMGGATGVTVPLGGYEETGFLSLGNGATSIDGCGFVQFTTPSNLFLELQTVYSLRSSSDFDIPNALLYSAKVGYYNKWFYAHAKIGIQNSLSGFDIGSQEFRDAGGLIALRETEVDYTNVNLDVYVPVYKDNIGVSTGYAVNVEGRNYIKESAFSIGLVYKTN